MSGYLQIFMLSLIMFPDLQNAQSRITITAKVGSSVILPCDWRSIASSLTSTQSTHVEWLTLSGMVLKRAGQELYQGEGYEGRVDVPVDRLLKGDCSLVLRNVLPQDVGIYESYTVVKTARRYITSDHIFVQSVELSIDDLLYAKPQVYITATMGSTAVFPCDWRHISIAKSSSESPHVEWRTIYETVFERRGEELFQSQRYKGRVDVPEEELLKGNCSLVIKNLTTEDTGVYEGYRLVKGTNGALQSRHIFLQSVKLSVVEILILSYDPVGALPYSIYSMVIQE
ncbi:uncharacterized protein [Hoplias malabaricus]|uniref:uncharacterized protein isoform X2 n=1 Tax=Hoplias malabaricus TaxID=27720 RepID=UPI00346268E3